VVGDANRRVVLASLIGAASARLAHAAPSNGDSPFVSAAKNAVATSEREDGFSGVILVARGDQVLLREAAGLADRENNVRITAQTRFPIASINKQFTAAAILLLVQDGKLSLDDPLSNHLDSPEGWRDVTIKHLLTHTSGIIDNYASDPQVRSDSQLFMMVSYRDLIRLAVGTPLVSLPGTGFRYANTNYILLTAVIERASGQSYEDFLRNRILIRGLNGTGYGDLPGGIPKGYRREANGEWKPGIPVNVSALAGAGAMYSTVDDLLLWHRAMLADRIIPLQSRQAIFADYGHNYGFGWFYQSKFNRKVAWNAGNLTPAGYASIFDYFVEDDLSFIVLTNNTGITELRVLLNAADAREVVIAAYAARKLLEQVEKLYFTGGP
jgi:CubicO group peptidase (beta-lactamase class C family)